MSLRELLNVMRNTFIAVEYNGKIILSGKNSENVAPYILEKTVVNVNVSNSENAATIITVN